MTHRPPTTDYTTCADCGKASPYMLPIVNDKRRCRHCVSKLLHPYWPRGRYNGERIVGVRFTFKIDVTSWHWKPFIGGYVGAFHWLCVYTWTSLEYEQL